MKSKSVKELIDQSFELEADRQMQDIEWEKTEWEYKNKVRSLSFCIGQINAWKKFYLRKNSVKKASIYIRHSCRLSNGQLINKYLLQLFSDGKHIEEYIIDEFTFYKLIEGLNGEELDDTYTIYTYLKHTPTDKKS